MVQNKNQQINNAIIECFEESKSDDEKLGNLIKSQKFFKTIKDLKNRLMMCERPAVNCGWGNADIEELITSN